MNRAPSKSKESSADDATAVDGTTGGERSKRQGSGGDAAREHGGSEAGRLQNGNAAIGLGSRLPDGSNAERPNPLINRPGDRYEQEAERVADAVMASGFDRETSDGETENRIPTKGPSRRLTVAGPRIQRQDRGPQPDRDRRGQRRQGNQPQRNQPPGNQPQANQQQGNQQGNQQAQQGGQNQQGNGWPMDLDDDQINRFTAVIKAEAGSQGQEDPIRWVYYNLVHRRGVDQGLDRSAAYEDGFLYRYWLVLLELDIDEGADELGEDANHAYLNTEAPAWTHERVDTLEDYINRGLGTNRTRNEVTDAESLKDDVEDMFEAPTQQQYEDFTGQGNEDDLNGNTPAGDTLAWQRARRYYRLQEGLAEEGEDSEDVEQGVIQVIREGGDPQVIIKWQDVTSYFSNNPAEDPANREGAPPEVDL